MVEVHRLWKEPPVTASLVHACRDAGVRDDRVLDAVREVDRAAFLPRGQQRQATRDAPLPIGEGQTTSQPSLIARMVEALALTDRDSVLEVGTGSGYQTAILSRLAGSVVSVDRHPSLVHTATAALEGLRNVRLVVGDGTLGWPDHAPYDAITVGATGPRVPPALLDQLADGGRLVIPVGPPSRSSLQRWVRHGTDIVGPEHLMSVRFVPLIGREGFAEDD